jgi:hypothetical protein
MARPAVFINPDLNTPEDIARAQALLGAIAPNYGKAANVGEGIAQLMIGLGTGVKNRKLAKAETAGRAQGNSAFEKIMGAMSGANTQFPATPSMGGTPQEAATPSAPAPNAAGASAFKAFNGDPTSVVSYANDGAIRNQPVTSNLQSNLADAITAVYGPGYKASVYSGGQTGKRRTGSVRHDNGRAADVYVIGPDGKKVQGDALAPLGQYWAAKKYGGVGLEMHGGGIHLDEWSTPPKGGGMAWNYAKQGGQYTPAMQQAMALGLKGQMPSQIASQPSAPAQPQQVASLDPSVGMPAMAPIPAQKPGIQAISAAMGNPAPNGMAAPQQAPQQMAQAAPSDIPPMPQNEASSLDRIIGMNTPLGAPQPQGLDVGMLMQAAQNPWLTDTQKTMVNTLLQQEMQKQDPAYQMQQQAAQVGLQRDQLQLEQMRDPSKVPMTPMEQLQMQKSQLELQQLQNPTPKEPTTEITDVNGKRVLVNRATGETIRDLGDSPSKQQNAPAGYQMNPDGKTMSRIPGYRDTNLEMDMRKEFDGLSKDFRAVRDSYNRIQASAENPTPAGDLSLIFNYMKMLDPGSVVREAEFATAANAAPLLTRFGLDAEKLKGVWEGQRLTPEQRADFLSRSDQLYQEQDQTFQTLADQYTETAKRNGLAPENIILTPRANPRKKKTAPTAAPEGVDPSIWEHMTTEERALWN